MRGRLRCLVLGLTVTVAIAPGLAFAQGNGNGKPKAPKGNASAPTTPAPAPSTSTPAPSQSSSTTPTPSASAPAVTTIDTNASSAPAPFAPVLSFRQFGTWLDDASAPVRGEGSTSISAGYWRMADASQANAPMFGASYGMTDRLQVSASLPFYRMYYQGTTFSGMDDVYVGGKYTLIDPTLTISEFGLAISPVMEILSAGAPDGRVHFAIPVTMELRRDPMRIYGSAGYFTRGSVFTGGALEWATPAGVIITGAVTQSYSMKEDPVLDSMAVGRQRMDLSGSAAYPLGSIAVAFGSVGRSLTSPAGSATSLALTGGVAFRLAPGTSTP